MYIKRYIYINLFDINWNNTAIKDNENAFSWSNLEVNSKRKEFVALEMALSSRNQTESQAFVKNETTMYRNF